MTSLVHFFTFHQHDAEQESYMNTYQVCFLHWTVTVSLYFGYFLNIITVNQLHACPWQPTHVTGSPSDLVYAVTKDCKQLETYSVIP